MEGLIGGVRKSVLDVHTPPQREDGGIIVFVEAHKAADISVNHGRLSPVQL